MRTLQEKYNGVLNESFSKAQFVRDARQQLPNLITQFNGFNDTVTILKNKGMIQEAKQEVPEYDKPAPGYSLEALERGVDYELQGMGVDTAVATPTEDQYSKAKEKAEKNLEKDPNHYLNLLSGDSKKVDKHDKYVEVKKNNHVDTFNGMKKAELKEGVESLKEYVVDVIGLIKKKYPEVSNSDIKDFIKMHFADIQAGADPMEEFEEFLSVNPEILNVDEKKGKDLDGDGDIDSDDYMAAKDAAIKKSMGKDVDEASPTGFGTGQGRSKTISKGREERPDLKAAQAAAVKTAPKFVMKNGVPHKMKDGKLVPLTKVTEGRRKKMQGGKVVTENDYETGGYVESMGPHLENAIRYIVQVWDEWKDGPMTEPGMVPFAKKDLLRYIDNQLAEMEEANMSEEEMFAQEQLKEGIKHLITNLLNEEVITEAATGNLSKMADTYSDFEGMQSAVNALENIVTDVESYYAKTKEKIQKIYDSFKDIRNAEGLAVGPMLAPAIEAAFRKDLMPVTEKGFTKGLTMPTVKILKPGDIAEEELEEKETVFTPVNESKKYKYTKRQK